MRNSAVTWLKNYRYGVKIYPINQSINHCIKNQEVEFSQKKDFAIFISIDFTASVYELFDNPTYMNYAKWHNLAHFSTRDSTCMPNFKSQGFKMKEIYVNVRVKLKIWLKSNLYRIEDLITPHYWSCSSELRMNFVLACCVMILTNQIAYFKRSSVFFEDD